MLSASPHDLRGSRDAPTVCVCSWRTKEIPPLPSAHSEQWWHLLVRVGKTLVGGFFIWSEN